MRVPALADKPSHCQKISRSDSLGKGVIMLSSILPIIVVARELVDMLVNLYTIVIIVAVVVSWLVAFGVLNSYNQFARMLIRILGALTEPVFRRVRRIIPPLGGLDLSPMIIILLLWVFQRLVDLYTDKAIAAGVGT